MNRRCSTFQIQFAGKSVLEPERRFDFVHGCIDGDQTELSVMDFQACLKVRMNRNGFRLHAARNGIFQHIIPQEHQGFADGGRSEDQR